jgi:Fe-S-cluster containining protein
MSQKTAQRSKQALARRTAATLARLEKAPWPPKPVDPETQASGAAHAEALAVLEILSEGHTPAKAREVGTNAMEWTSGMIAGFHKRTTWACTAGCAWCCRMQVSVTLPEAAAIVAHVQAHCDAETQATLKQRVSDVARQVAGLSIPAYFQANVSCAFLTPDNRCAIYAARPVRCRGYYSADAAACAAPYASPEGVVSAGDLTIPIDPFAQGHASGVQAGIKHGCAAAGLDGRTQELHAAVRAVWDDPKLVGRWVTGGRAW